MQITPIMSLRSASLAGTAIALAMAALAPRAEAISIINFGQTAAGETVTFDQATGGLTITGASVNISQIDGGVGLGAATMNLSATADGAATLSAGTVTQDYSGTFDIFSATCSTHCLQGSFTGAVVSGLSGKSSLGFNASTPPSGDVLFTSSLTPPTGDLGLDRALSLSFTNPTSVIALCSGGGVFDGASVCSDTWNFSGNASANLVPVPPPPPGVPEPASMALLGTALVGLSALRRRRG